MRVFALFVVAAVLCSGEDRSPVCGTKIASDSCRASVPENGVPAAGGVHKYTIDIERREGLSKTDLVKHVALSPFYVLGIVLEVGKTMLRMLSHIPDLCYEALGTLKVMILEEWEKFTIMITEAIQVIDVFVFKVRDEIWSLMFATWKILEGPLLELKMLVVDPVLDAAERALTMMVSLTKACFMFLWSDVIIPVWRTAMNVVEFVVFNVVLPPARLCARLARVVFAEIRALGHALWVHGVAVVKWSWARTLTLLQWARVGVVAVHDATVAVVKAYIALLEPCAIFVGECVLKVAAAVSNAFSLMSDFVTAALAALRTCVKSVVDVIINILANVGKMIKNYILDPLIKYILVPLRDAFYAVVCRLWDMLCMVGTHVLLAISMARDVACDVAKEVYGVVRAVVAAIMDNIVTPIMDAIAVAMRALKIVIGLSFEAATTAMRAARIMVAEFSSRVYLSYAEGRDVVSLALFGEHGAAQYGGHIRPAQERTARDAT